MLSTKYFSTFIIIRKTFEILQVRYFTIIINLKKEKIKQDKKFLILILLRLDMSKVVPKVLHPLANHTYHNCNSANWP